MALTQRQPAPTAPAPLYTRYCVAPAPAHPVREPSLLHALLVAAWLGKLIDPLPVAGLKRKTQDEQRKAGDKPALLR